MKVGSGQSGSEPSHAQVQPVWAGENLCLMLTVTHHPVSEVGMLRLRAKMRVLVSLTHDQLS